MQMMWTIVLLPVPMYNADNICFSHLEREPCRNCAVLRGLGSDKDYIFFTDRQVRDDYSAYRKKDTINGFWRGD